MKISGKKS